MVKKTEKKLAAWKAKHLSFGGRITLIQFALSNLPVYFMPLFRCPGLVVNRLEELQHDFFVARKGGEKENTFGKLGLCLQAKKKEGGLGSNPLST